jgi:hypothetical protein
MALVGDPIPQYVRNQILVRQASYGSGSLPGFPRTDEILLHQNANNAFIKMASGVSISTSKLSGSNSSLGIQDPDEAQVLSGMGLAKRYVLFGGTSYLGLDDNLEGTLFQKNNFIGAQGAYEATQAWGIVPMPGIESLEVKSLNRGSLKKATVKLTAQNRDQLAILDVLYMRLGYTVLIEWGNSIYMSSNTDEKGNIVDTTLTPMLTSIIENNTLFFNSSWSSHKSYSDLTVQISKFREKYNGNFDALLGKVSNFNWTFNSDGSYSIELTVISLGDVVESLKTNVIGNKELVDYVERESTEWRTESEPLDQHRKDNIILTLLHIFRTVNFQLTTKGENLTIETKDNPTSYLGYLLQSGSNTNTISDHIITETITAGFRKVGSTEFIKPSDLTKGYYLKTGEKVTQYQAKVEANKIPDDQRGGKLEDYEGYGYDIQNIPGYGEVAGVVFNMDQPYYSDSVSSGIINVDAWKAYKDGIARESTDTAYADAGGVLKDKNLETNPAVVFRNNFLATWSQTDLTLDTPFNLPTKGTNIRPRFFLQPLFQKHLLELEKDYAKIEKVLADKRFITSTTSFSGTGGVGGGSSVFARTKVQFWYQIDRSVAEQNIDTYDNPLFKIQYKEQDACVINLDNPQYYIRLGFLLDLLKQKVITRVDIQAANLRSNPNLFNIDTSSNQKMLCLPKVHISYDWRTCIVRRDDFNRKSWQQKVFPKLRQWADDSSNTADIMNIYMNFNFIATAMSSNTDERGNISVYDFIKAMCDGINKAMAGVNNLEPVIDEDTNTLRILESSPIPKSSPDPGYTLQLYGYGNGNPSPIGTSTFVRKIDLKTAITPEYATMVTVGATANGYVKGTEATAFARWNDGLTDRFKTELLAADADVADPIEDTAQSFDTVLSFSSKCFGIEGNGRLWETFPNASSVNTSFSAYNVLKSAGLFGYGGRI